MRWKFAVVFGPLTNRVSGIWRWSPLRTRFCASGVRRFVGAPPYRPAACRLHREGLSMSDFDRNYAAATRGVTAGRAASIDAGLRAYMTRVYNYMAIGVALTGVAAWLAYQLAGGDAIVV